MDLGNLDGKWSKLAEGNATMSSQKVNELDEDWDVQVSFAVEECAFCCTTDQKEELALTTVTITNERDGDALILQVGSVMSHEMCLEQDLDVEDSDENQTSPSENSDQFITCSKQSLEDGGSTKLGSMFYSPGIQELFHESNSGWIQDIVLCAKVLGVATAGTFGGLGAAGLSISILAFVLPTTLEELFALGLMFYWDTNERKKLHWRSLKHLTLPTSENGLEIQSLEHIV
ncbi:hypothetical protein ACH5RR_039470 [Cinchona calisaya]|uniref:Uncharacterized protein n=1 Tax=Cinchona calisaya TaxID=153742 RepID=A0ABD2Y1R9_9GENT